ncbi:hypothetical protein NMY22_g16122 [Coprinellus aureogranulatus]|nr:hypothetical protein NMY22_g16122 [Coprinellus aureogranulatus]
MNAAVLETLPDPTDFPAESTAPGLRKLDATFRCSICGDPYDAPVTINCGHCFCSGCLRSALATKQECPACRKPANEGHIRPNYVLEAAISAWNDARSYVLGLISKASAVQESPRKRKRQRSTSPISVDMEDSDVAPGPSKRPSSASRSSEAPSLNPQPDEPVECPICSRNVPYRELNNHMDRGCPDPGIGKIKESTSANAWSKLMQQPKPKSKKQKRQATADSDDEGPLPKVTYATLKERQIKDLLQEHNLSTQGDRATLEQRHKKWVMLYNANLDRSETNRKSQTALRQELKKWEETMSKRKKAVIDDPKEYTKKNKSEFDRLIELARPAKQPEASSSSAPQAATSEDALLEISSPRASSTPGESDNAIVIDDE